MDKKGQDNRTNQCNPSHTPTGPGQQTGYHGAGTKADLDNHSNQLNPNNPNYGQQTGYHGAGTKADLDNHSNQLNPNNPNYGKK